MAIYSGILGGLFSNLPDLFDIMQILLGRPKSSFTPPGVSVLDWACIVGGGAAFCVVLALAIRSLRALKLNTLDSQKQKDPGY